MHIKKLIRNHSHDIMFLLETERHKVINVFTEIGDEHSEYRAVQIRSTDSLRSGMIAMIKLELQLGTAEILRIHTEDEFDQAIVLLDSRNRAYVGWYNSPHMSQDGFGESLDRLLTDYDTQAIVGDFNARHPRWCSTHDRYKRGARLLRLTNEMPQLGIHAPPSPTFMAIKNKKTGTLRSSTVDLVLSRTQAPCLTNITGYVRLCSDHHPIIFKVGADIDKRSVPRLVPKTLL